LSDKDIPLEIGENEMDEFIFKHTSIVLEVMVIVGIRE
jgi:hypothetical protein